MRSAVCDTSPLQYLHQLGLLHLLPARFSSVLVPPAVLVELARGRELGCDLPDPRALAWCDCDCPMAHPELSVRGLGKGELEVLAIARQLKLPCTLDDRDGRRVASRLGLDRTGTLGILLKAKQLGLIGSLEVQVAELRQLGFRLDELTVAELLKGG